MITFQILKLVGLIAPCSFLEDYAVFMSKVATNGFQFMKLSWHHYPILSFISMDLFNLPLFANFQEVNVLATETLILVAKEHLEVIAKKYTDY